MDLRDNALNLRHQNLSAAGRKKRLCVHSLLYTLPTVPSDSDYLGTQKLTGREVIIGWG